MLNAARLLAPVIGRLICKGDDPGMPSYKAGKRLPAR